MVDADRQPVDAPGLFTLPALVLTRPKARLLRSAAPRLILTTVEGTPLAAVWEERSLHVYTLTTPGGHPLLQVEVAVGRFGALRPVFRVTDTEGAEEGSVESRRRVLHAGELHLRTAAGDTLRLGRTAPLSRRWLLTEDPPDGVAATPAGRVTAGHEGALRIRSRYLIEPVEGLGLPQRRIAVASVVCLCLIRDGTVDGGGA